MGLLVHTTFDTQHGFTITSVYCRIARFTHDPLGSGRYCITIAPETHISREARLTGKMPVYTPGIPGLLTLGGVLGDMTYLYSLVKAELQDAGFQIDDVIEPMVDVLEDPPVPPSTGPTGPTEESTEPTGPTGDSS